MNICTMGYELQKDGKPPLRCHNYPSPDFCTECGELDTVYTIEEIIEAIKGLKDWDNYKPFHKAVDNVLVMFTKMEDS